MNASAKYGGRILNAVPEPVAPDVPVTVTVWLWVELALIPPEVPENENVWLWSLDTSFVPVIPVDAANVPETAALVGGPSKLRPGPAKFVAKVFVP